MCTAAQLYHLSVPFFLPTFRASGRTAWRSPRAKPTSAPTFIQAFHSRLTTVSPKNLLQVHRTFRLLNVFQKGVVRYCGRSPVCYRLAHILHRFFLKVKSILLDFRNKKEFT